MGVTQVWLGICGRSAEDFHSLLQVAPQGVRSDLPETDLWANGAPDDWHVVGADGWKHVDRFVDDKLVSELSKGARVVRCFVDEHSMQSEASEWADGKVLWTVRHDSAQGASHLDATGELPPEFETLRDTALEVQKADGDDADVDHLFGVPQELAEARTGFQADVEGTFEALRDTKPSGPQMPADRSWSLPVAAASLLVGLTTLIASAVIGRIDVAWPIAFLSFLVAIVAIFRTLSRPRRH